MPSKSTNPAGKHGKPFTLAPMKFDDALRKILAAPPEPKQKAAKQEARRPTSKKTPKRKK